VKGGGGRLHLCSKLRKGGGGEKKRGGKRKGDLAALRRGNMEKTFLTERTVLSRILIGGGAYSMMEGGEEGGGKRGQRLSIIKSRAFNTRAMVLCLVGYEDADHL